MEAAMRIGELSRRTGVSPELLRAWEQRYALMRPERSPGGFRLYSTDDERRVRRTTDLISQGLSAAEAARVASSEDAADDTETSPLVLDLTEQLRKALDDFDSAAAHAALDSLLGTFSIKYVIADVLIPYLVELGERWAHGTVTVAQEHFASNLLRGRMLALAREWGDGGPSTAVLACLPGEAHDLGLILFGILLGRRGWRVTFLGADTPFDTIDTVAPGLDPTVIVISTLDEARLHEHADAIARLAASMPVAVAAPVEEQVITALGAQALVGDIVEAAESLTRPRTPSRARARGRRS
jgi:MerR family transcriptional regulator, light-induced transcriptional regulator